MDSQGLSSGLETEREADEKNTDAHHRHPEPQPQQQQQHHHHHQHNTNSNSNSSNKHTPELDLNQVAEEDVKGEEEAAPQSSAPDGKLEEKEGNRGPTEERKDAERERGKDEAKEQRRAEEDEDVHDNRASHASPRNQREEKASGRRSSRMYTAEQSEVAERNNGSVSRAHLRSRSRSLSNSRSPRRRRSSPANGRRTSSRSPDKKHGHGRRSSSPDGRHSSHLRSDERRKYDRNDSPPRRSHIGRSRSRSPPSDRHSSPYHDRDRSHRSRYSPRRRSPPRHSSRRDYSPRRRPWSPPPNRNTGVGKPGNNLFVAGFSFGTSERDLEKKFSRYGHVTDVRIIRDRRSGDSRGFGFLSLESDEDADAAIRALDQTEWNGRIVLVEKAKTT